MLVCVFVVQIACMCVCCAKVRDTVLEIGFGYPQLEKRPNKRQRKKAVIEAANLEHSTEEQVRYFAQVLCSKRMFEADEK